MAHPDRGFAERERDRWENDATLQGFRELFEKTLAAYDWGEAFVALNLVAKPAADETLRELGSAARHFDDHLLALLIDNQMRDGERSRRWSAALVEFCTPHGDNKAAIQGWIDKWMPLAEKAIADFCTALPENDGIVDAAMGRVQAFHRSLVTSV